MPVEKIKEYAEEVLTVFTPEYTKQFAIQTVKAKIDEKMPEEPEVAWQLIAAPVPDGVLMEGFISKQGEVRKSWKKRWAVLMNAADRYAMHYYESEKDKGDTKKAKGRVMLGGYEVHAFDEAEEKEFGKFGIKLKARWCSEYRRVWLFRAETDELYVKWREALEKACRKAPPPLHPDKVLQKTFLKAYSKTRDYFWPCGAYPGWGGTEEDHLSSMITERCDRDLMGPVWAALPSGPAFIRNMAQNKVKDIERSTIGAAVSAAWKGCQTSVETAKPTVDKKADESVGAVAEKQVQLEQQLQEKLGAAIRPVLSRISGPVAKPMGNLLLEPVLKCYKELLRVWISKMRDNPTVEMAKQVSYYADYWNQMDSVWRIIRDFVSSGALKVLDALPDFDAWDVDRHMWDRTVELMRKAAHTFQAVDLRSGAPAPEAYQRTTEKLTHDCKLATTNSICFIVCGAIMEPFKKEVVPLVQEQVAPLKDTIPEALQEFIDIDGIVERVLSNTVQSEVEAVIIPICEERVKEIVC